MDWVIGVDFDNTIVSYDKLIYELSVSWGLVPADISPDKKLIRDEIRQLPNGDGIWQRIQARIYGPDMAKAIPFDGVFEFFQACNKYDIPVYIVSHKTEYSNLYNGGVNFRDGAREWLQSHRFFDPAGAGLSPQAVYFASTRQEKINYIDRLQCTHFIDDLEEIFGEEMFPVNTEKILYAPHHATTKLPDVKVVRTWKEVHNHFFKD